MIVKYGKRSLLLNGDKQLITNEVIIVKDNINYLFTIIYNIHNLFDLNLPEGFKDKAQCNYSSFNEAVDAAKQLVKKHNQFNIKELNEYVWGLNPNCEVFSAGSDQWLLKHGDYDRLIFIGKLLYGSTSWDIQRCKNLCYTVMVTWGLVNV